MLTALSGRERRGIGRRYAPACRVAGLRCTTMPWAYTEVPDVAVPCWLSEYEGEQYYLGIQTDISADFDPPYLGHQALVEGMVSDEPRIYGDGVT